MRLLPLGRDQNERYLTSYDKRFQEDCSYTWQMVYDYLGRIYDLSDLMKRPILLAMMVETVLGGFIKLREKDEVIGPALSTKHIPT